MQTTTLNGRKRPALSDQIDRLDRILDGLADGLNQAVATAVQEAVRSVLTELLSRPELVGRLAAAMQPAPAPPPVAAASPPRRRAREWIGPAWRGLGNRVSEAGRAYVRSFRAAGQRCITRGEHLIARLHAVGQRLRVLGRYGRPVLLAVAVGTVVGLGAYSGGPWLAGLVSGLGAAATSLAVQVGLRLRRLLRRFAGRVLAAW